MINDFLQCNLGNLTEYAVAIRYPGDFCIPDHEEAKKACEIATGIRSFVMEKLGN